MQQKILEKLLAISIKTRILRFWQTAVSAAESDLSEREIMTLELIGAFPEIAITEKKLSKILVISPSSVSDMVRHLIELDVLQKINAKDNSMRGKALSLTKNGVVYIENTKKAHAARMSYLFSLIEEKDLSYIADLLDKIEKSATEAIKKNIFDIWS